MTFVKKIQSFLLVLVLILAFVNFLLVVFPGYPRELMAQTEGVPIVKTEPVASNRLGIQQIAESADRIYLLHQKYCIVSVYNKNGEYEHTISVYSHPNGRARIAVVEDKLHLLDENDDLYVFHGTRLVMYSEKENSAHLRAGIDFDSQSKNYILRGSNIYTYDDECNVLLIIERPWYLSLYQRGTTLELIMHLALLVLGAVFVLLSRHIDRKEGKGKSAQAGS